jgi:NAD(P)-dependent dehydrogenase (short-subunit alcohol dehydrogenase family)
VATVYVSTSSITPDLDGQVALVTGGGRGLGALFADALARAGAAVAVVSRTTTEVTAVAERIRAGGGQALAITGDVTDQQAVERLVVEVEQRLGGVDVLVNNAGQLRAIGPVWEVDPAQWWREVEVNLRGPFLCARAVLPRMIARQHGRIINVASGAGTGPIPAATAYAASKAALINFTDSLAGEARSYGVSAFAINPGTVRTPMNDDLLASALMRQWHPWFHQIFTEGRDTAPDRPTRLVVALAAGRADALSGRYIDESCDLSALLEHVEEIVRDDRYTLRLRT